VSWILSGRYTGSSKSGKIWDKGIVESQKTATNKMGRTQINRITPDITWQISTRDSSDTIDEEKYCTWDSGCEISEYSKV
jgi:hypothetical protein